MDWNELNKDYTDMSAEVQKNDKGYPWNFQDVTYDMYIWPILLPIKEFKIHKNF